MVYEFPELQGVMGQKALASGESEAVAAAIEEHYFATQGGSLTPNLGWSSCRFS